MKLENILLKSFFAACLLLCVMTLGAMVTTDVSAPAAVASQGHVAPAANAD
ncbi:MULTISPECIES: hypothetical protein [Dyella]|uniref:hypothetical protein n=1 Tax=Dyella TaxID=231454 RepID=UPI0013F179E6|nr:MULTISPECIES: hypothetical protein [Dyella]